MAGDGSINQWSVRCRKFGIKSISLKGYQGSNYRSGTYSTHIVDGMAKIKDFSINNWEMQRSVATIRGRDRDNTSFPPPSTHLSGGRGFKPLDHKKNSAQKSSVRMKG